MSVIVDLILKYWVLIIVICVVALMMIIGYYVESNGLVKSEAKDKKPKKEKEPIKVENEQIEKVETSSQEQPQENATPDENQSFSDFDFQSDAQETPVEENKEENTDVNPISEEPVTEEQFNIESEPENNTQVEVTDDTVEEIPEENFEEFEEYFDKVLPEEPVISDELKKYIDEFNIKPLSLSKDKKMVDTNIRLPEIKNKDIDDDIWSF